jgi:hypothetical protein
MRNLFRRTEFIVIAFVSAFGLQVVAVVAHGADGETKTIDYRDIPERVRIIGKLGLPFGDLATIRGRWTSVSRAKPSGPILMVGSVDGKPLNPPAEFTTAEVLPVSGPADVPPAIGEVWELRGAETGGFQGVPPKVLEEHWKNGSPPSATIGYRFCTKFIYVTKKTASSELPPAQTSPKK